MNFFSTLVLSIALVGLPAAQDRPVCDVFTDADVADLFGARDIKKQTIIEGTCSWTAPGIMLMASRQTHEPELSAALLQQELTNARKGEEAKEVPGLGQRAVMTTGPYGRSLRLIVASGGTLWTFALDKVDQKLDMAVAQPKLRALAAKAVK